MASTQSTTRAADAGGPPLGTDLGIVRPKRGKAKAYLPGKAQCLVCGRSISDRQFGLFQSCDFWKCRAERRRSVRVARAEAEARQRREREQFERRLRQVRDAAARLCEIEGPEKYVPMTVPALGRPSSPPQPERCEALREHLIARAIEAREASIAGGEETTEVSPDASTSPPLAILERACALCGGFCCSQGGNTAYQDAESMARFMASHPDLEPSEVADAYVARIPRITCEDSCIFHTAEGCGLPRELRARICNTFECVGLRQLRERLPAAGPLPVFLVAEEASRVVRYAFVSLNDEPRSRAGGGAARAPAGEKPRNARMPGTTMGIER